ncbi:MAG: hypothetical protein KDK60_04535 [Chlamydiia bacterium]|nr:hypothetical protein [Chlamydiia bacterium]
MRLWLFLLFIIPSFAKESCFVVSEKTYRVPDSVEMRTYSDVILDCGKYGDAHFTISLPEKIPSEGLPCIVIVGGLKTGRESLQFIPDHRQYALIAYEYPAMLKKLHRASALWNLYSVRKAALEVPPELIGILKFVQQQSWFDHQPISLMGYSFGATFLPVTYVRAEQEGIPLGPGVMAYGGAGVYCLFKANLPLPRFLKKPVASMAAATFKPIDPILYAPDMKGEFLILNGTRDHQIPMECAKRLQDLVPEPKTIMNLDTGHMHPTKTALNLRLINISRDWLEKNRIQKTP